MRKAIRTALFASTAALGLALAGCDSAAENQVEQTGEALDENAEAEADLVEALEGGGPNEDAVEAEAAAMREEGEETKDTLEDMADELDDTPQ